MTRGQRNGPFVDFNIRVRRKKQHKIFKCIRILDFRNKILKFTVHIALHCEGVQIKNIKIHET